jgi:hypothetical protein
VKNKATSIYDMYGRQDFGGLAYEAGSLVGEWGPGILLGTGGAARAGTYVAAKETELAARLARIESRFAGKSREVGFILDAESGDILAVRRAGLDSAAQMRLSTKTDFPLLNGNILTHNHPLGGTFSIEDIATALGAGAKEIRAVTNSRTMSLKFDSHIPGITADPVGATLFVEAEKAAIGSSYRSALANGTVIPPADLAARRLWAGEYMMQEMVKRNPWMRYTSVPR